MKHFGHEYPIRWFLNLQLGPLVALRRIPHIVTIYTEKEGGPLLLEAAQQAGSTKEKLIEADLDYREQLWQRRLAES